MDIGSSPNWVKVLDDGRLVLSRYGPAPGRATLEIIDPATGRVTPAAQTTRSTGSTSTAGRSGPSPKAARSSRSTLTGGSWARPRSRSPRTSTSTWSGPAVRRSPRRTAPRSVACAVLRWGSTRRSRRAAACRSSTDGGLVWGARADELWAIDPATSAVTRRYPLTDVSEILDLDIEGDDAWIAGPSSGSGRCGHPPRSQHWQGGRGHSRGPARRRGDRGRARLGHGLHVGSSPGLRPLTTCHRPPRAGLNAMSTVRAAGSRARSRASAPRVAVDPGLVAARTGGGVRCRGAAQRPAARPAWRERPFGGVDRA